MDLALGLPLLILTAPLWLFAALAIKAQDGGPVFYRQQRIGRGGVPFGLIKFRSMVSDAEARGSYQTVEGDARITPAGRWLRRTSIDELPQLLNVLAGDMSLVGPRPDTPAQERSYSAADWRARCSVRPGLTGLAQVSAKSPGAAKSRIELDLDYIRSRSIGGDLRILGMTVVSVLRLRNR